MTIESIKVHNQIFVAKLSSVFTGIVLSIISLFLSIVFIPELFDKIGKEVPSILIIVIILSISLFVGISVKKISLNWFLQRRKGVGIFLFLIISLLLLLLSFIGCVAIFLSNLDTSGMCAETVLDEIPSPNGKLKAVIFQIDCGATTGFNSHVSIMASNSSQWNESQKPFALPSLFAVDTNHGKAPSGTGGGPEIQLSWISDTELKIQYHEFNRVIRAKHSSKGIDIEYQTFR